MQVESFLLTCKSRTCYDSHTMHFSATRLHEWFKYSLDIHSNTIEWRHCGPQLFVWCKVEHKSLAELRKQEECLSKKTGKLYLLSFLCFWWSLQQPLQCQCLLISPLTCIPKMYVDSSLGCSLYISSVIILVQYERTYILAVCSTCYLDCTSKTCRNHITGF